ncbi:hypothetical protein IFM89_025280 [Coptis chinensis]|uniref:Uncharacterized protein n=1 Tax=Coptis chinensis TaxID=261450 RepID=A0A835HUV0_9MAGN|nr:hypothetical protein IFM89_025280 [Coptis chinensis]
MNGGGWMQGMLGRLSIAVLVLVICTLFTPPRRALLQLVAALPLGLRCFDIFTPQAQKILRKYRKENFAEISLVYSERQAIGKCPLTPEEKFVFYRTIITVGPSDELVENTWGLLGSAVDYMVCLLADIFMPTYDGPSNFANNVMWHHLYYGFHTIIQPDRQPLAPIFIDRENHRTTGFEEAVRCVMQKTQASKTRVCLYQLMARVFLLNITTESSG